MHNKYVEQVEDYMVVIPKSEKGHDELWINR